MTKEEAIRIIKIVLAVAEDFEITVRGEEFTEEKCKEAVDMAIEALEQEPCEDCISKQAVLDILDDMVKDYINENDFDKAQGIAWVKVQKLPSVSLKEPCEMTAEEYRRRMIQAFHNTDCDELIAICVLPTEKEFEHLEWLLEKHYKAKPEPCDDAISRQAVLNAISSDRYDYSALLEYVKQLPSVTPQCTDAEIQRMQELEQAEIQKAYEIGRTENIEVLDKVRAEIEAKCCITVGRENDGAITLHDVFEIIDKYNAERSDE